MEQEVIYDINQEIDSQVKDSIDVSQSVEPNETQDEQEHHEDDQTEETTQEAPTIAGEIIQIKQEIADNTEVHIEQPVLMDVEGVHVSIDDFINFHNDQMKNFKDDIVYLTRGFDIMYKYKTILDLIMDDYFKDDKHFKYKSIIDSLETDLVTFIAEDEEKYQGLLNEVNTDIVLNEDSQLEFVELDNPNEEDEEVVNGINEYGPSTIRKLPGQKTAPLPECPACGFKARCRLKLEAHLLEHQENPLVVCNHDGCEVPFDLHNLTQHEKDYHPEICLICEMCNEMFDNKTTLVQHYKLHITKKEKLKCNFPGCEYTDIYAGRMDRHKKAEHNMEITKQFKCDFEGCGRVFKDRPSYYTHSLIHKDRSLVYKHKCTYENCGAVFKRRRNLALHSLKHGFIKKKYTCMFGECRRSYTREKELMRHIEYVHRNSLKKEPTDGENSLTNEINQNEDDDDKLIDGSNDDDDGPPAKRTRRGKSNINEQNDENSETELSSKKLLYYLNKSNSKVSESNNNNPDDLSMFDGSMTDIYDSSDILGTECELCQTSFDTPNDLMNHLKERHHQYTVKAYHCDFEDCTFTTHFRSVLGKHKNDVHGGKYKCEVCGKLSKDSGNHNRHRNIHKNIMYRCRVQDCEKTYKSPKAYYVHVLTHSNEQPVYSCDYPGCKYITHYMNTLNVHKLTHSDVRNFFCPYENCAKGFKRNGDLNKHIIHSHKGIKRPQKKRKLPQDIKMMLRCNYEGCNFTTEDNNQLNKHEEEHLAAETVQDY